MKTSIDKASIMILLILMAIFYFIQGCASSKSPLKRDKNYPAAWQDILSLGVECKKLNGAYSNEGIIIDSDGKAQAILLTDILPVRIAGESKIITLNAVTQYFDSQQDTFATLQISMDGTRKKPIEWEDCFCVKQALFYVANVDTSTSPFLLISGSQQNIWLTQDTDGALIARITNSRAGVIVLVPYVKESSAWARFERIRDSEYISR